MLKTETCTPSMEKRIRSAARAVLGRRRLSADFEHGQWWITDLRTGGQWSVVDASGGRSVGGFDFERVTEDGEC